MEDQDIIVELKKGNTTVFQSCYERSFRPIKKMVRDNSGTEDDARDIFHDAFILFYKNVRQPDFELTASIPTYLYSICWRLWMNQLRKNKMVKKNQNQLSVNMDLEESFDFELTYQGQTSEMERLMELLNEQGKNCLEILLKYYFQKLSYDIIAYQLNYASGQVVREQKYRCLKRVRSAIEKLKK